VKKKQRAQRAASTLHYTLRLPLAGAYYALLLLLLAFLSVPHTIPPTLAQPRVAAVEQDEAATAAAFVAVRPRKILRLSDQTGLNDPTHSRCGSWH
jgi:hypothetical protein